MALSVPRPQSTISGTPFHAAAQGTSTPGEEQTVLQFTVPPDITRNLTQAIMAVRQEGIFTVKVDGDVIGSGRTGPGQQAIFVWTPIRAVAADSVVELLFTQRPNSPPVDIEGYVMASDLST